MSYEVGTWAAPPPTKKSVRTLEIDADVERMKRNPGKQMVVGRSPGRASGCGSTYRSRGCQVTTRMENGWCLTFAWWPTDKETRDGSSEAT